MDIDIMKYEGIVHKLAGRFYGAEREDLIQAGFLGLSKAIKNYDRESNAKFSTYAFNYIYGEMYETANGARPIKVNKDSMRLYKRVSKYRDLLIQKLKREVSYEEAAVKLGIDPNTIRDILNSLNDALSIETTEINLSMQDRIDDRILLRESLDSLTDIEKRVMENRYLEDLSQTETAKVLGLTQVKVSRLEKSSKEKMREFMAS